MQGLLVPALIHYQCSYTRKFVRHVGLYSWKCFPARTGKNIPVTIIINKQGIQYTLEENLTLISNRGSFTVATLCTVFLLSIAIDYNR